MVVILQGSAYLLAFVFRIHVSNDFYKLRNDFKTI